MSERDEQSTATPGTDALGQERSAAPANGHGHGMVLAALRGKRLVVSTATTALQDQLARKDVAGGGRGDGGDGNGAACLGRRQGPRALRVPAAARAAGDGAGALRYASPSLARQGVHLPEDMRDAVRRIALIMPARLSSTAQDLSRGKQTEIDHLNGFVVRKGEHLGVPTPVNRTLLALIKLLESR